MTSVELNKNNDNIARLEKDWNAPQYHRSQTVYIMRGTQRRFPPNPLKTLFELPRVLIDL